MESQTNYKWKAILGASLCTGAGNFLEQSTIVFKKHLDVGTWFSGEILVMGGQLV